MPRKAPTSSSDLVLKIIPIVISVVALCVSYLSFRQSSDALKETVRENASKRRSILLAEQTGPLSYKFRMSQEGHVLRRFVAGVPSIIQDAQEHVEGDRFDFSRFSESIEKRIRGALTRVKPGFTRLTKMPLAVYVEYAAGDTVVEEIQILKIDYCHWWEGEQIKMEFYGMRFLETLPKSADPRPRITAILAAEETVLTERKVGGTEKPRF